VREDGTRRALRDESGQVLVITSLMLVVLLCFVAMVVDIGSAYVVQRQLQAGVDSAALAAAQHLPDAATATQAAQDYGPSPGKKNSTTLADNATTTVTLRCIRSAPGCGVSGAYNAVYVRSQSDVRMTFARLLGINKMTVSASATACSPCSAKPLDIMLVLDRTGSMCQFSDGSNDPNCTDLRNAKDGMKTFLGFMDPQIDKVGFAVFPPALDRSNLCTTPNNNAKRYGYDAYWPEWIPDSQTPPRTPGIYAIGSMSNDYLVQSSGAWILNPSSDLVQKIGCTNGAGTTSYSNAIEEAQHELDRNGTGGVQDVIIFLSDGAANTTPRFMPSYMDTPAWRAQPCGAGINAAAQAKAKGTIVFSIGYDLNGQGTDYEQCRNPNGQLEGITSYAAMQQIATEASNFYNKPDPGQLNSIFTRIAASLDRPAARLISDDAS